MPVQGPTARRFFFRLLPALASALGLLALAMNSCSTDDVVEPHLPCDCEAVRFRSTDGVPLSGKLFGAGEGKPGVVLSHMSLLDQRSWQSFAETLKEWDYMVFTFDFRGHGRSGGAREIEKIHHDVEGAVQVLRERGVRGVFLIGASMGGTASLKVAAQERFLGVATLSAPMSFQGLDVLDDMNRVNTPLLVLAAEDDKPGREAAGDLFYATGGTRIQEIYRGDEHGTDMLTGPFGADVEGSLLDFVIGYTR